MQWHDSFRVVAARYVPALLLVAAAVGSPALLGSAPAGGPACLAAAGTVAAMTVITPVPREVSPRLCFFRACLLGLMLRVTATVSVLHPTQAHCIVSVLHSVQARGSLSAWCNAATVQSPNAAMQAAANAHAILCCQACCKRPVVNPGTVEPETSQGLLCLAVVHSLP